MSPSNARSTRSAGTLPEEPPLDDDELLDELPEEPPLLVELAPLEVVEPIEEALALDPATVAVALPVEDEWPVLPEELVAFEAPVELIE